jgi:Uma2 family endonuclease
MEEYLANGARLGWLIDPQTAPPTVTVYRPDADPVTLADPATVSGAPVLPGFALDCGPVFHLDF